ncbi:MAG: hypothetical protein QNK04_27065 [Myxococcota bacterium]|nr:hypothetical protein [Myxococcota bacterium]
MADFLSGYSDERRHVGFGENRIGGLVREHPERKPDIERLQKEMSYGMPATFADSFRQRPAREEMRRVRQQAVAEEARWQGADLGDLEPREGQAGLRVSPADPLERLPEDGPEPPRRRFTFDDRGFDEVPRKYRRFYRRWGGLDDVLAPNEALCPVCKVVVRSSRELRPGDGSAAWPA